MRPPPPKSGEGAEGSAFATLTLFLVLPAPRLIMRVAQPSDKFGAPPRYASGGPLA